MYTYLFVRGLMSYLRYLCLFGHSGVQRILCYVFALFFLVLSTLCSSFSGLSIFDCSFGILLRLFANTKVIFMFPIWNLI